LKILASEQKTRSFGKKNIKTQGKKIESEFKKKNKQAFISTPKQK
jgi:hypothetical protein